MKLIQLSTTNHATKYKNKYFVQVDDVDYDWLMQWKWHVMNMRNNTFYASRNYHNEEGKIIFVRMHRLIMNAPIGKEVDHIDHNGLNNQRSNLRICTPAENRKNIKKWHEATSKFVGVYFGKSRNKWVAEISLNGKNKYIGSFKTEIEAARARDTYAKLYHGEFAHLNFPA